MNSYGRVELGHETYAFGLDIYALEKQLKKQWSLKRGVSINAVTFELANEFY